LWVVDLESRKNRQVTSGAWRIDEFSWAKSDRFFAIATDKPRVETWNNALFSIELGKGAFTPFGKPNQPFNGLLLSPAREQIAYVSTRNSGPIPHDLYVQAAPADPLKTRLLQWIGLSSERGGRMTAPSLFGLRMAFATKYSAWP
jgi:hypothetical protein